jgi:hypothetical protein
MKNDPLTIIPKECPDDAIRYAPVGRRKQGSMAVRAEDIAEALAKAPSRGFSMKSALDAFSDIRPSRN